MARKNSAATKGGRSIRYSDLKRLNGGPRRIKMVQRAMAENLDLAGLAKELGVSYK